MRDQLASEKEEEAYLASQVKLSEIQYENDEEWLLNYSAAYLASQALQREIRAPGYGDLVSLPAAGRAGAPASAASSGHGDQSAASSSVAGEQEQERGMSSQPVIIDARAARWGGGGELLPHSPKGGSARMLKRYACQKCPVNESYDTYDTQKRPADVDVPQGDVARRRARHPRAAGKE